MTAGNIPPRPDITRGQLAQAAGCDPTNPCYFDCCQAWGEDLEEWDTISEKDRQRILGLAEWVYQQTWV
jgi:hypothetical protein